jgi:small subunit ribosomal protein S1
MEETNETTPTPVEETTAPVVETTPVVDVEIKAPVEETVATAHDDFDWSVDKRNVTSYTAEEKAKYDTVYDNTFKQIADGEMIQATVESLTKTDAVVNIGFKSDGLIS